jgi:ATP-dependent DNA ligase
MRKLRVRSCIIDGEAVACGDDGLSSFDRLCYRQNDAIVFMCAFDLIELDGDDLRRDPLAIQRAGGSIAGPAVHIRAGFGASRSSISRSQ